MVFIIRKDIEKEFKEVIGGRIASICSSHNVTVDYAFQDINDIPGTLPEGRTKPWGTGQAVLAAKDVMAKYFGTDGFRGEAGITLTADHAYKVGRFLGWYYNVLRERNGDTDPARIVIGKDTRRSSYMFEQQNIQMRFVNYRIRMDLTCRPILIRILVARQYRTMVLIQMISMFVRRGFWKYKTI